MKGLGGLFVTRAEDENGQIDVKKVNPLCYASGVREYYTLGEKVGKAFSDGLQLK